MFGIAGAAVVLAVLVFVARGSKRDLPVLARYAAACRLYALRR